MDFFPLAIFPSGSLANSVVTTVWIGVLVVGFLNLRLGWVLSGLVVPGYLAPLIIAKPWAASAIVIEGIVTYLLIWFYSERIMKWFGLAGFFGRDRFFAIILASVLVRILFDGLLFPMAGEWVNKAFHLQFDYRYNLHSFGLIIVSLIANAFWKTGIVRGFPPFLITIGITWLITRYGLMEFTNFSISNVSYMYEDMASSMLASPKSYVILITAAFIASRMNLRYGWDFNGILIPSLLALQWYQPDKILYSFIEALVVLWVGILVLRLPYYQGVTVEGARKMMLFFNISFLWKILLGFLLVRWFPQIKVTDYFGFGYMLPTLIAIKMHDKEIVSRLTRATLQISLVAVAGATLVGFALTFITAPISWSILPVQASNQQPPPTKSGDLPSYVRAEKLLLYQGRRDLDYQHPLQVESDLFMAGVKDLRRYLATEEPQHLIDAATTLKPINYHLRTLEDRYLVLEEGLPRRGWGTYIFSLKPDNRLVIEIPAPLEEWGTLESGVWILESTGARALAMAGSSRYALEDGSANVLRNRQSLFHLFHREMGGSEIIQIRALIGENRRALTGEREVDLNPLTDPTVSRAEVWVQGTLPEGVNWVALKEEVPGLEFIWETPPLANIQRDESHQRFAEIYLDATAMRSILLKSMRVEQETNFVENELRIDGYLQAWLFSNKGNIAPQGSDLYKSPTFGDLLYWDSEVLTPLIATSQSEYIDGEWSQRGLEQLQTISSAADQFGYQLTRYRHRTTQTDYLILAEPVNRVERYWGTYVLRLGEANNYLIQAPRPLFEGSSFEFAVHLFDSMAARWLLIGGTHPNANLDGSADLVRARAPLHLFNLVNQVVLRESGPEPHLSIQSRAFGIGSEAASLQSDLLIAFQNGIRDPKLLPEISQGLLQQFDHEALSYHFVDGSPGTSGYEVGLIPQSRYLDAVNEKYFSVLWLAPRARRGYRQQDNNLGQDARYAAIGISTVEGDLFNHLQSLPISPTSRVPEGILSAILPLQDYRDFLPLSRTLPRYPELTIRRYIDLNSSQAFLLVYDPQGALILGINLEPRSLQSKIVLNQENTLKPTQRPTEIRRFIDTRSGRLEVSGR